MITSSSSRRRLLRLFVTVVLAAIIVTCLPIIPEVHAETTAVVVNVTSYLNVRNAPVSGAVIGTLSSGARVIVLDTSNSAWYKIQYGSIVGYCSSEYLQIQTNTDITPSDPDFETSIASFPESYKSQLRQLHELHPNWTFTAVDCGDWSSALSLETRSGVSLVPLTSDRSWLDLNERGVVDSPNWVNASDQIVAYYLDPRNMLSEGNVFQFMDLRYSEDSVSISETAIAGALQGTFMSGSSRNFTIDGVNSLNPFQAFAIAGIQSRVNPIFLVTHVIQECGANGSSSSSGASGYYNLYNIGAYSNVINASRVGLSFAQYGLDSTFNSRYNIPWNTAGKSCVYGANWIADYYVYKGQNTLYFMRFNLAVGGNYTRGNHQYMTALQSCSSESSRMYQAYKRAGIIDSAINFKIPVYTNMPSTASAYPVPMNETGYPTPTNTPTPTPTSGPATATPTPIPDVEFVGAFVSNLYVIALNRNPDEVGFAYWVNRIYLEGASARDISIGFVMSDEMAAQNLSNTEFVQRIYLLYLGRWPEDEGLAYWAQLLDSGVSRETVTEALIRSPEFVSRCETAHLRPY